MKHIIKTFSLVSVLSLASLTATASAAPRSHQTGRSGGRITHKVTKAAPARRVIKKATVVRKRRPVAKRKPAPVIVRKRVIRRSAPPLIVTRTQIANQQAKAREWLQLLSAVDFNRDGRVSAFELYIAPAYRGVRIAEAAPFLRTVDVNRDGFITKIEFITRA